MFLLSVLRCEQDRQMACPFADPGRATHRARPEPFDRRTLIGMHCLDVQVLADELVIVLGVRYRRLEQLAPVARDRPRRKSEDSSRLLDRFAADVVTHQSRLARRRPDVLGLRPDDRGRKIGVAAGPAPARSGLGRLLGSGLGGPATARPAAPPRRSRSLGLVLWLLLILIVFVLVLELLVALLVELLVLEGPGLALDFVVLSIGRGLLVLSIGCGLGLGRFMSAGRVGVGGLTGGVDVGSSLRRGRIRGRNRSRLFGLRRRRRLARALGFGAGWVPGRSVSVFRVGI